MGIKGRLAKDLATLLDIKPKQHKYRAKATVVDGITFQSRKEADHYQTLKALEKAGAIKNLRLQVPYKITIQSVYKADFVYEINGEVVVQDVKGFRTREYKRKKRLVKQQHGIDIQEV